MWRDVIGKRPDNFRAYVPVISASLSEGHEHEARRFGEVALKRMQDALGKEDGGKLAETARCWMPAVQNELGRVFLVQGNNADAIRCFNDALIADPGRTITWNNLGLALYLDGKTNAAMSALKRTVEQNPYYGNPRFLIALMLIEQGNYKEATGEFQKIPDSDSISLSAKCEFAWLLATCPDAEFRDGNRAISLAENVNRATRNLSLRALDVLAAAYAEAGRFDDAVKTANQALLLLSKERVNEGSVRLISGVEGVEFSVPIAERTSEIPSRLKLYEARHPFRMNSHG
jgi:tetratricopeptide (TPR) repeat protein